MVPIVNWVKNNKLSALLILVVLFFVLKGALGSIFGVSLLNLSTPSYSRSAVNLGAPSAMMGVTSDSIRMPSFGEAAPAPQVTNRMVVQNSNLSLMVKDVVKALKDIKNKTTELGGYMVDSNLTRPEEAASGEITLRIPADKLDVALDYFRSLAVKVVSENLQGTDVTDQFVDNDARLKILTANKAKFEEIMNKAVSVQDTLEVQREIFNLQSQIDSLKGQQNFLTKTSEMAKITIFVSTDELTLPYAPAQPWRPDAVFKRAVRSLVGTLQGLGSFTIWLAVYSVVWAPALVIFWYLKTRWGKKVVQK